MVESSVLEEVGFSKAEALVYLALLKLGKTKSGNVIKSVGLQSSVVHNSLNSLIEKGFVGYVLEGKLKSYSAINPKIIEEYLESKKKEFKRILPELESLNKKTETEFTTTEVYESYNGLYVATLKMIEDGKKGDVYRYFTAEKTLLDEGAIDFFKKVDLIKRDRGITVKGIAQTNQKNLLKDYKNSDIRYTSQEIPPAMNIFGDMILIISLSNKPTGILIKSKEIAKQYSELWESLWRSSKR